MQDDRGGPFRSKEGTSWRRGASAEACPKLAESQRLDPAPGTLLNLALCYERNGQLASAWVTYRDAASVAQNADQPDRAHLARRKAEELEPKLATLTIVVPPASDRPDLVLKRDGDQVGRPGWGTPIPIDPGPHVIEASAPGRKTWQGKAVIERTAAPSSIEVHAPWSCFRPTRRAPTESPLPAPRVTQAAGGCPSPAQPSSSGQRTIGVVVGGVGLAALVAGGVFGFVAKSNNDSAKSHCLTDSACNAQGLSLTTSAEHAATLSTIGFVAGGIAAAAGVVLYLTAPSDSHRRAAQVRISPLVGATLAGASVGGEW